MQSVVFKVIGGLVVGLMAATGIVAAVNDPEPKAVEPEKTYVQQDVTTVGPLTVTETIPYKSTTVDDDSLAKGTTQVRTVGADGEKTITYEVTYKNGVEVSRNKVDEQITREPINEVVVNGTYVKPAPTPVSTSTPSTTTTTAPAKSATTSCPSGYYVNVNGNCVSSPTKSNNGGASAVCRDGTYSYSQNRRGTCSSHGGVAGWL